MTVLADLLGHAKRDDLFRISKGETLPYRGKRKHGSQMTKREKDYLVKSLKHVKRWRIRGHAKDRLEEKGINATYEDITSTIHNSTIIEYHIARKHNEEKDVRVLLRANNVINDCNNLNVVYSLSTESIVSFWLNDINDKHGSMDWSIYDKSLKIRGA